MGERTCECDDALGQFCPRCHPLGDGADGYIVDIPGDLASVRAATTVLRDIEKGIVSNPDAYAALVAATNTPGVFPPYSMGSDIRVTEVDPATVCPACCGSGTDYANNPDPDESRQDCPTCHGTGHPDPFTGQRLQVLPKYHIDVAGQIEVLAMALDTVQRECEGKRMSRQATMEAVAQAAVDTILTPLFKKFDPGLPPDCSGNVATLWRQRERIYRRIRKAAGMPVAPTEEDD